jgi:predicted nicotinamide N-methyase
MADDVTTVCRLAGNEFGLADPDIPYWAFVWPGGLALARYLLDQPHVVARRRVLDIGSGSGLCAIVALRSGAEWVRAVDIDPFAEAAIAVNGPVNGVRIGSITHDILGEPPPPCDVILAGDVCYQETMAGRAIAWLRVADRRGTLVLIGDPGRRYLPTDLERVATYRVTTSREVERAGTMESGVYTFKSSATAQRLNLAG